MVSGYKEAIRIASERLSALNPDEVCAARGAEFDGSYSLPFLGRNRKIDEGSDAERILILHYLTGGGGAPLRGEMMSFRESPGGLFYGGKFEARAVRPLIKRFGRDPRRLIPAGKALCGAEYKAGDAAVSIPFFPRLPITYIVWGGDEEMPPCGVILFDKSASSWLPPEDLVVAASLGAYALTAADSGRED